MDTLLLLLALVFGVWLFNLQGRIRTLESRIATLIERMNNVAVPPVTAQRDLPTDIARPESVKPPRTAAKVVANQTSATIKTSLAPAAEPVVPASKTETPHEPAARTSLNFEELVGGKLPIWIGGIALAFAGFFLVRFTIEAGLLGPGVRSTLAAIFAMLLITASQYGGGLPKIGNSFAADPRIAQSLAGAGVAILYGTLYMAAEIYGLIGVPLAFLLLILTTGIAFALALRHGPPTALMGLVGGFVAPWVAGLGPNNMPLLLLYLGVFLAGLFGLALWRRWLWLLLLASGGGALWTIGLIFTAENALPLLGLFVLLAGGAAVLAADRFAGADRTMAEVARYVPMGLALVQLAMLLPRMQFGWMAWGLYATLCATTVALAWRDARHLPSVFGALMISATPMLFGWESGADQRMMTIASVGIGLLFALPAHLRTRAEGSERPYWALAALMAQAVPFAAAFFALNIGGGGRLSDLAWALIAAALVLPAAAIALSWQNAERRIDQIVQTGSAALAAVMAWLALVLLLPDDYLASSTIGVGAALAAWASRCSGDGIRKLAMIPIGFGILLFAIGSWRFYDALGDALIGQQLMLSRLPELGSAAQMTLLPAALLVAIAMLGWFRLGARTRVVIWTAALTGLFAYLWLLAKQPLAIDSPSQFISYGLAERVAITQILFAAGWALLRWQGRNADVSQHFGLAMIAIALFRLVWFDLGVFNPLWVPQALGPAPIANLGTLHLGLGALWLWLLAGHVPQRLIKSAYISSLVLMALTALISVRQLIQGNLVSGAIISTGENYLYSAALLALAIGWLAIGIKGALPLLRIAGLSLLTLVTLKVFLIDAAALQGVLRILSFLGLGIALIGIGWAYGRLMSAGKASSAE